MNVSTANIRIDPANGDIVVGAARIGKHTRVRELRAIDPEHFEKTAADGDNFFCVFADIAIGDHREDLRIVCRSYHRDGAALTITLEPYGPGGGWDNFSEAREARKLALLEKILAVSGIASRQDFSWGHVVAAYDGRSGVTALTVAYYQRVRG